MFDLGNYSMSQYVLVIATLLGAFGGMPKAPRVFENLAQNEIVQWALVFVLLYQGGAGEDVKLALMVTGAAYGIHKYLVSFE
jgi:hypothetical protein